MSLPDLFLADLPPGATLDARTLTEACETLRRNRVRCLDGRGTPDMIDLLDSVGHDWRQAGNPFRKMALEADPRLTKFPARTLEAGLDALFAQLTRANLEQMIEGELGHPARLDRFVAMPSDRHAGRAAIAKGPGLLVHVIPGNLPNTGILNLVLGLLLRAAQFVKCSSQGSFLTRLFAHSVYQADPRAGACIEIAEWKGGHPDLEDALFSQADCLTVTGDDETLLSIRNRLPPRVRFAGYGRRLSLGYIAHERLFGSGIGTLVAAAADDIVDWNQRGCLSPHAFYVQQGPACAAEQFAEHLAAELDQREQRFPRGDLPLEIAAEIASHRAMYELRASASPDTRIWQSRGSTAWTVVYEADPRFQPSCLNRFIYVKGVRNLAEALRAVEPFREHLSTVAIDTGASDAPDAALELARFGVSRVCPLGRMQSPPLAWHHDGRPALGDLVTWTDWER